MAAVVSNVRVWTLDRDSITVEWKIPETAADLATYTVEVWRSESEYGPFQRVSLVMRADQVFDFQDRAVNILSKWREFFYIVRLTNTVTSEHWDFGANDYRKTLEGESPRGVTMEAPPDLEAAEAIRRFKLTLREYAGRRVLLYRRRTWGQRCLNCWDFLKRRSKLANCLSCFDTGFTGGYYSPVEQYLAKPPHEVSEQLTPIFELQVNDVVMWCPATPRVKPDDLVVDIDGRRWRVVKSRRGEKGWALTRQTLQVRELSKDQVEYDIPVSATDWGVNSLTAAPLRQHIRATDIDSYHAAVQTLGIEGEQIISERSDFATQVETSNADG